MRGVILPSMRRAAGVRSAADFGATGATFRGTSRYARHMSISLTHRGSRSVVVAVIAVAAIFGVLVLSGCTNTLDMEKAETEIKKGIEQQTGLTMKSVDCPDSETAKKGATFECTAVADNGTKAPVKVTQKDDKGNITWELNPGK